MPSESRRFAEIQAAAVKEALRKLGEAVETPESTPRRRAPPNVKRAHSQAKRNAAKMHPVQRRALTEQRLLNLVRGMLMQRDGYIDCGMLARRDSVREEWEIAHAARNPWPCGTFVFDVPDDANCGVYVNKKVGHSARSVRSNILFGICRVRACPSHRTAGSGHYKLRLGRTEYVAASQCMRYRVRVYPVCAHCLGVA